MLCIDVLLASYAKENSIITMKRSRAGQLLERMKKYIEPDDNQIILEIPVYDQNEGKSVSLATEEDIKNGKIDVKSPS